MKYIIGIVLVAVAIIGAAVAAISIPFFVPNIASVGMSRDEVIAAIERERSLVVDYTIGGATGRSRHPLCSASSGCDLSDVDTIFLKSTINSLWLYSIRLSNDEVTKVRYSSTIELP